MSNLMLEIKKIYSIDAHESTVVSIVKPIKHSDLILTLSVDKKVNIISCALGEIEQKLFDDAAPTRLIKFNKADKILIPRWDNSFSLLNISSLQQKEITYTDYLGHSSWVLYAIELNNKENFATCSRDKTIKVWSFANEKCLLNLTGHNGYVNYLIEVANGTLLSAGSDGVIKTWNLNLNGEQGISITDGELPVFQIEKVDNYIVTRNESKVMNVWNYNTGEFVRKLDTHKTNVICLKVLRGGKIASGSYDHTVKIWDLLKNEEDGALVGHNFTVYCIDQMKNRNIVTGSGDNTVKIWSAENYQCLSTLSGHQKYVVSLCIISDKVIASGGYDGKVIIWRIKD